MTLIAKTSTLARRVIAAERPMALVAVVTAQSDRGVHAFPGPWGWQVRSADLSLSSIWDDLGAGAGAIGDRKTGVRTSTAGRMHLRQRSRGPVGRIGSRKFVKL